MNDGEFSAFIEAADLLKVLAHPVRLCIVKGLIEKGECNVTHMQNCLRAPQSTISQHLQKLKAAGIIEGVRSGLEIHYKVRDPKAIALVGLLFNKKVKIADS
ncbi:ArsR/SmtB family transcription factor [Sporomusa acidovorans]|uniref:Transcriptional repressor PagR n=1 Tax=Sporomusa acidovorans (strain ATCC 49682 / DSM 3132 / Mol) TaxID=1123286 RepID=A0ABZ3J2K8_SPOA4|nr:metalloregulator ArsR/SmtB family transcription factor [Sporomusa acidovorans]OZC15783.1 transcriptional repressor PagR [Sporomusa acidovorans DSM 3132]SDF63936.1 transcriptional regulator, ArsR family [Sporomusa acidovorans]